MEVIRFTNRENETPFAASWNYYLAVCDVSDQIDIDWYKNFLLEKETELLEKYTESGTDGGTQLGLNSLTSKFPFYTIWDYEEMSPLKSIIKDQHDNFLNTIGIYPSKIYCQGWYNVMREGEQIKEHQHLATPEYGYLSAHLTISCENTHTYYRNPITREIYSEPNSPGKLTFFSSYVPHYTSQVVGCNERITIAFDIVNEIGYNKDIYDDKKHRWHELQRS